MQLSIAKVRDLATRYQGMQKRIQNIRAEAEEKVMIVVQTAEVCTAGFAFGLINGRWQRPEFVGVPVDALAGMALHAAAFAVDSNAGGHLHNLGDGALCSYVVSLGMGVGGKMRLEAGSPPPLPQG